MADWHVPALGGKTLLQYADTPAMDWLAAHGCCGLLKTVPDGFHPGSEVANSSILGYDQHLVYEGRGPLEAAAIGVELQPGDLALRCNLVCIEGDILKNHSCGRLDTEEAAPLIDYLNEHLASDPDYGGRVRFYTGVQYRHLLVIRGGNKNLLCTPPHDIPLQPWRDHQIQPAPSPSYPSSSSSPSPSSSSSPSSPSPSSSPSACRFGAARIRAEILSPSPLSPSATAALLRDLVLRSQELLPQHYINKERAREGRDMASSIWPWGGGYRPQMTPITQRFHNQVHSGSVITAVDLIRGIGHYAGLRVINVPGATGLYDTNFEGKAQAAIDALLGTDPASPSGGDDFVYLHVEASDEAGHDGSVPLKLQTIEDLDHRLIQPILKALYGLSPKPSGPSPDPSPVREGNEDTSANCQSPLPNRGGAGGGARSMSLFSIALLPDHPTPCEHRTHTADPIPFCIYYPGITPDSVQTFDEDAAKSGTYGLLEGDEFIKLFMDSPSPDPSPVREGNEDSPSPVLEGSSVSASRAREGDKSPSHFYRTSSPDIYPILKDFAKENRKEATTYEDILWQELRKNQLGVRFRRQHSIGDYIADFVCLPLKLIIEVDGGYHNEQEQAEADRLRGHWLQNRGYQVLRFTNEEVAYDLENVISIIKLHISNLQ